SSNARYPLEGGSGFATLRPELVDLFGTGQGSGRTTVVQDGNSFTAEVFVPVWTSLLYVNDWFKTNQTPFRAAITQDGSGYSVEMENLLGRRLTDLRLAAGESIFELGNLEAGERKT